MKKHNIQEKVPMSIISTQIPEEIADAIKAQAESMEVTPSWLVRKIIKSYINQSQLLKLNEIEEIKDFKNISKL
ncbi:MAG: hypothetical protein P8I61_02370 [Opitutae bacterium]|nr:hypothetical protein [Opitutae bacterium]